MDALGGWLMEATVTPGYSQYSGVSAIYPNGVTFRRAITFHRITGFKDPVLIGDQWHRIVTIEQPFGLQQSDAHFPVYDSTGAQGNGDARPVPDDITTGTNLTFPIPFQPGTLDGVNAAGGGTPAAPRKFWVPVFTLDGLQEVYKVNNQ